MCPRPSWNYCSSGDFLSGTRIKIAPFFSISPAVRYWRIAHARIYSGTSSAQKNNGNLYVRSSTSHFRSLSRRRIPGSSGVEDIFGWSDPQVQRNIVDKQLQTMFQMVRVWMNSPLPGASRGSIDDTGIASPKALWVMAYRSSREIMRISRLGNGGVRNRKVGAFYRTDGG
jgi:hypothetical protein